MRFVHCADLHIGCRQFDSDTRFSDFGSAFDYIAEFAVQNSADCVLISGDLFHHRNINAPTLSQATAVLQKLRNAHIEVFAIEGNHDKAYYADKRSWMEYLNDSKFLKLLKPSQGLISNYDGNSGNCIEFKGVRIIGLGYNAISTEVKLDELDKTLDAGPPTIVMLHGAVDNYSLKDLGGFSSKSLKPLENRVCYFAMGHIHSKKENGLAFNPGAPENVHIDESRKGEEKGFYLCEISDAGLKREFIPSPNRDICYIDIDLGEGSAESALDTIKARLVKRFPKEGDILSLRITGSIDFPPHELDTSAIRSFAEESFAPLYIDINNMASLKGSEHIEEYEDRESLEKGILSGMALDFNIASTGDERDAGSFLLQLRTTILEESPENVIDALTYWQRVGASL